MTTDKTFQIKAETITLSHEKSGASLSIYSKSNEVVMTKEEALHFADAIIKSAEELKQ